MRKTFSRNDIVLTLTFPPDDNPNYGGILQAWALQQALKELGVASRVGGLRLSRRAAVRRRLRRLLGRLLALVSSGVRPAGSSEARLIEVGVTAPVLRFARTRIDLAGVFDANQRVVQRHAQGFAAYVVGSDQVWRPDYANTADFMLGFLSPHDTATRVAYAPSFGRAKPDFTALAVEQLAPLIRRFAAVSVREDSAAVAVAELWQVEATRLVDPTMLIRPPQYRALVDSGSDGSHTQSDAGIISYVLDRSASTVRIIEAIEETLGGSARELVPSRPRSYRTYLAHRKRYLYPPIETWLAAIDNAAFVVTDSFHGCVFSCLFNVPFAVMVNQKRGTARFETLLGVFGLADRIVSSPEDARQLARRPIDWNLVNDRMQRERDRSFEFLRSALKADR